MRRPRRARGLVLTACVLLLSACSLPGSPDAPQDPTPSASSDSTPTTTGRGVKTEPIEDATASEVTAADVAAAIGAAGLTDWPTAYERVGPLTIAAFPDALREGLEEAAPELLMVDSGFLDRAGPSLLAWAHAALAEDRMLYATSIDEQLAILEEALADVPPEQFAETVTNGSLQGTYPGLLLGNTFGPVEVSDPRFRMGWYLTFDTPLNDEHVFASASLFVVSTYLVNGTPMVLERALLQGAAARERGGGCRRLHDRQRLVQRRPDRRLSHLGQRPGDPGPVAHRAGEQRDRGRPSGSAARGARSGVVRRPGRGFPGRAGHRP